MSEMPIYLIGAVRSPSVRFVPGGTIPTLSSYFGHWVAALPDTCRAAITDVFITRGYQVGDDQAYLEDEFLKEARLPNPNKLRIRLSYPAILGGLDVLQEVVDKLRHGPAATVLIVGGEGVETAVTPAKSDDPQGYMRDAVLDSTPPPLQERRRLDNLVKRRDILSSGTRLGPRERELGLTPLSANALLADGFFRQHVLTPSQIDDLMSLVTVHLEKYARLNRMSYQFHREKSFKPMPEITPERYREVLAAEGRNKKWPFHVYDCCAISNGCAAVVLTNDNAIVRSGEHHIQVASCVVDKEDGYRGLLAGGLVRLEANRRIWRTLERETGLVLGVRPNGTVARRLTLELFDSYAYQIPMTLIDMGMFDSVHTIVEAFRDGYFDPLGRPSSQDQLISDRCGIILNPSGGSKDGHPTGAFALVKIAECYNLLTGQYRDRHIPVDSVEWAIVHNVNVANMAGAVAMRRLDE